jgi:hypothetical protein
VNNSLIIKIILAILLIVCLASMPYGYYQAVRFFGMLGFVYLGLKDEVRVEIRYFWFASAILINPIIKIPLGRDLWNIFDVIWSIVLIGSILLNNKKSNHG